MKYKSSIIIGLTTLLTGFIPLSLNKKQDITYTIYSQSIVKASKIKEELIVFYKQYCYSFSFSNMDKKITENIHRFPYSCKYENYNVYIYDSVEKIKMTGYLFETSPSSIQFKYYLSSIAVDSMPEAISTRVATDSLSDQIW